MRFKGGLFFLGLLSVCASALSAKATTASQPAQSATWRPYNLTLDLYHLPVRYSCDDLSGKFHDAPACVRRSSRYQSYGVSLRARIE